MHIHLSYLLMLLLCLSCGPRSGDGQLGQFQSADVIYGQYDLVQANKSPQSRLLLGQSVAIRVGNDGIQAVQSADGLSLNFNLFNPLRVSQKICANEPLANEINFGSCTGFLVAPKLLLTAAHCLGEIKEDADLNCKKFSWAFGASEEKLSHFSMGDVHGCSRVAFYDRLKDYALIELDSERLKSKPLRLAKTAAIHFNGLYSYSYPKGTALKYSENIQYVGTSTVSGVIHVQGEFYKGSSGSPIINDHDEVVGLLRAGVTDFVEKVSSSTTPTTTPSCKVTVYAKADDSEDVTPLNQEMLQQLLK